jgi:hypothetical protein
MKSGLGQPRGDGGMRAVNVSAHAANLLDVSPNSETAEFWTDRVQNSDRPKATRQDAADVGDRGGRTTPSAASRRVW